MTRMPALAPAGPASPVPPTSAPPTGSGFDDVVAQAMAAGSMTVAPTKGAHLRSVMWGARGNHWKERAERGVVSKELIRPVCKLGRMSVTARGMGE